jgi:hypothetical protein
MPKDKPSRKKTQPSGALEPPARKPPTAVATATPPPPPAPERRALMRARPSQLEFVSRILDAVDELGDMIASALRLRPS